MNIATDKDIRLFRFGAVVPEEHQELALRLAELEDRLNAKMVLEANESGIKYIYFIPTVTAREDFVNEQSVIMEEEGLFIRVNCPPVFELIREQFLIAIRQSDFFSEEFLEGLAEDLL